MNDAALIREIEMKYPNTAGLVVLKNGRLIYERYFDGHNETDTIHIFSVTKSISSLLVGMALDQGFIQNVDQKVLDFFPDYVLKRGENSIQEITLKHLLTMTAPYKYKSEPFTKVFRSDDWTKAGLDLLGGKGTIGSFRYSTVGSQIISGILQNAIGKSMLEFAGENLFKPLEIKPPQPTTLVDKETHIAFIKNKNAQGWVVDPQGLPVAGWGLTLCPRDMAKIGQLCLNQGVWNGKQLVSDSWIQKSTTEHSRWNEYSYGYLWWILRQNDSGTFAALGDSGNTIYVNRKEQIVIAIACHFKPRAKTRIDFINQYILPEIG